MKTTHNNKVQSARFERPRFAGGIQPCHRDDPWLAFGDSVAAMKTGQELAGTGALVFEGELLERERPFNRAVN
jgi:hypothetical protein